MRTIIPVLLFAACTDPVAQLSVAGAPGWAISLGGRADDHGTSIAVDSIA